MSWGGVITDCLDKGAVGAGPGWAVGSMVSVVVLPVLNPVLGTHSGFEP